MSDWFIHSDALAQIAILIAIIWFLMRPVGVYIANVLDGKNIRFWRYSLQPLEQIFYRLSGVDHNENMSWRKYAITLLCLNFFAFLLLYAVVRLQDFLPMNSAALPGVSSDLAFSIAASFISGSNWQNYAGETTLSMGVQIFGIGVQYFIAAANSIAVFAAFMRGFIFNNQDGIGNFWADITRVSIYILFPIAIIFAGIFASQDVVQTLSNPRTVPFLQSVQNEKGEIIHDQLLVFGPLASQTAAKFLGGGGGYYNASAAHPFATPTPLVAFLQIILMLLLPAALCCSVGHMIGDARQGWNMAAVMLFLLLPVIYFALIFEQNKIPFIQNIAQNLPAQITGNMEGKELRHGVVLTTIWTIISTATNDATTLACYDSLHPLTNFLLLLIIKSGSVIFGAAGIGISLLILYIFLAVFVSSLLVGKTPKYLGKKIGNFEISMVAMIFAAPIFTSLISLAVFVSLENINENLVNPGAHGFTELLFATISSAHNNGNLLPSLISNNPLINIVLAMVQIFSRFVVIIGLLAIAGSFAGKNKISSAKNIWQNHNVFFIFFVVMTVLVITFAYLPLLALGPISEYVSLFGSALK